MLSFLAEMKQAFYFMKLEIEAIYRAKSVSTVSVEDMKYEMALPGE